MDSSENFENNEFKSTPKKVLPRKKRMNDFVSPPTSPQSPGFKPIEEIESPVIQNPNAVAEFVKFCKDRNFAGFSFRKIKTEIVKEQCRKLPVGLPQIHMRKAIRSNNMEKFCHKNDSCFAILTGKVSGITVIDCDTEQGYINIISDFPELLKTLTIKTGKGYHIYCLYDPDLISDSKSFKNERYANIDIRNDGGLLFAPPSHYYKCDIDSEIFYVLHIDEPLIKIPDLLKGNTKAVAKSPKKKKVKVTTKSEDDNDEPLIGTITEDLTKKIATIKLLLGIFNKQTRLVSHMDWVNVALIIYNDLGDENREAALQVYKDFCEPEFHEQCEATFRGFNTYSTTKITLGTLVDWCKEDQPQYFTETMKKYIFREPTTFTLEELKAMTNCNPYDIVLEKRKQLNNNLPIYDATSKVFSSNATNWSAQIVTDDYIVEHFRKCVAYIFNAGDPIILSKALVGNDEISWTDTKYTRWKAGAGDLLVKRFNDKSQEWEMKKLASIITPYLFELQFDVAGFIPFANVEQRRKIDTRIFNRFVGFDGSAIRDDNIATELEKEEILSIFLKHTKLLCGDEVELVYDFLLDWMAHLLQFPQKKEEGGICLLFRSIQGTGKNILWDFFGNYVIGKRYFTTFNKIEQITGNFNNMMADKMLHVLDEVQNYGGAFAKNDYLKSLIASINLIKESKGVDAIETKNYARAVMLTNNEWPAKVEISDRRYCCLEPSAKEKYNEKYWDDFLRIMMTRKAGKVIFDFLINRKITWNPKRIPMTKFRKELMERSMPNIDLFMKHLASDEFELPIMTAIPPQKTFPCFQMQPQDLFKLYRTWFNENSFHISQLCDMSKFKKKLKTLADENPLSISLKKENWKIGTERKNVPTFSVDLSMLRRITDKDFTPAELKIKTI